MRMKYYAIGYYLISHDNGVNYSLVKLTQFNAPVQLELI